MRATKVFDISEAYHAVSVSMGTSLAAGSGTGQADLIWHDQLAIGGAGVTLDLQALGNSFFAGDGDDAPSAVTFEYIKIAAFQHVSGSNVNVGSAPPTIEPWGYQQFLGTGAEILMMNGAGAGWLVQNLITDTVRFTRAGADAVVNVWFVGTEV